ncbi:hypothetical protein RSAG8_11196, partial [Rhizoctonia solani AG-8 WAC10335]
MTSLEILTDEPPFGAKTQGTKIIRLIGTNKRPQRANHPKIEEYEHSDEIWQLFEECWKKQPEDRPSAREVVRRFRPFVHEFGRKSNSAIQQPPYREQPVPLRRPTHRVTNKMSHSEAITLLAEHGYPDITTQIEVEGCDILPFAGGGFGDVYRGYLRNGLQVAIKCPRIFPSSGHEAYCRWAIAKEGYTWSKHQHPNVVESLGVAQFRHHVAIISPWMENGTIMEFIGQPQNSDVDRLKLCAQVACGLAHVHGQGTIHGDIKGSNVLISKDGVAKLTDFGSTTLKQYSLEFSGSNAAGFTSRWAAPEVLKTGISSQPADIYALGMTVLEIMTGKLPFEGVAEVQLCHAKCIQRIFPERPRHCLPITSRDGDRMWNLLESCWAFNPEDRPVVAEVEHILSTITPEGLRVGL